MNDNAVVNAVVVAVKNSTVIKRVLFTFLSHPGTAPTIICIGFPDPEGLKD